MCSENTDVNTFKAIGTYAGIFFSLVVLHQTLRNQYPTGELMYLEYLFFLVYVTLVIFVVRSLFEYVKMMRYKNQLDSRHTQYDTCCGLFISCHGLRLHDTYSIKALYVLIGPHESLLHDYMPSMSTNSELLT